MVFLLSGELLLSPVKDSLRRHIMDVAYLEGLEITTAKLGDDAGLLGSLAQAQIKLAEDLHSSPKGELLWNL